MRKSLAKKRQRFLQDVVVDYLGGKCNYCMSEKRLNIHHIIPLSKGGLNRMSNLEMVCMSCHAKIHLQIEKVMPKKKFNKDYVDDKLLFCKLCGRIDTKRPEKCKNCHE